MLSKLVLGSVSIVLAVSTWFPASTFAVTTSKATSVKSKSAEVKKIKSQLDQKKKEINTIEKQIDKVDQELAVVNKDAERNQKILTEKQNQFKYIVKTQYIKGETQYLARLLEAESLSQFLNRFQVMQTMVSRQRKVVKDYQNAKEQLESNQKTLTDLKAKQAPLLAEAKASLQELEKEYKKHSKELSTLIEEEGIGENVSLDYSQYGNYGTGKLGFPTIPGPISWNFGQNRGSHIHKGVDIARPSGTPVYAADSGTVVTMKSDPGGYGYYIVIYHRNGLSTLYAHMYRSTVNVQIGQTVRKGQKIAEVGNNGKSYGARGGYHLHFEVHVNNVPQNPKNYLR